MAYEHMIFPLLPLWRFFFWGRRAGHTPGSSRSIMSSETFVAAVTIETFELTCGVGSIAMACEVGKGGDRTGVTPQKSGPLMELTMSTMDRAGSFPGTC